MQILENEDLRKLIQMIIDEDKSPSQIAPTVTTVNPRIFDPTEERARAPPGFFVKVPPQKYDENGYSIRSGSRQQRLVEPR
jgi:hypothetical protein